MIRLLSCFSGIGAFEKALDNLEIPYELVAYCEIDKYASKSYSAIHSVPESMNLGDITKVDEKALPKDIDLVTYGFPCQDISLAGKQKGLFNEDGTQTRSGLFFEALRIIEETQPKVAIAENVKNLTSKKFASQFQIVLESLEQAGYNNYWQVLNAKDYGIPQNRERVFIVSIRKDIDTGCFQFPKGFPLELRLKDMLEETVDEKYYLSSIATDKLVRHGNKIVENDTPETSNTIHAGYYKMGGRDQQYVKEPQVHQIGNCFPTKTRDNPNQGRIYDTEGLPPCLNQMGGGNRQPFVTEKVINIGNVNPSGKGQNGAVIDSEGLARTITQEKGEGQKILVREATKRGYAEAYEGDSINLEQPSSKTRRGRVGHGVAQTLTTSPQQAVVEPFIVASRGRNPENPSDRTAGSPTVQRLEPNSQGICNTLTTVLKDNYVAEPSFVNGDICKTVRTGGHGSVDRHSWDMVQCNSTLRIRKLTPKECFRLQGFDDDSFHKAEAVNSNTQLYKQAGNSICVPVVEYITKALIDAGIFGGEPNPYQFAEEQISFTDFASFDRYIETFGRE